MDGSRLLQHVEALCNLGADWPWNGCCTAFKKPKQALFAGGASYSYIPLQLTYAVARFRLASRWLPRKLRGRRSLGC
jgi:hypothetical protein